MTFQMSELLEREEAKRRIRETIEILAAEAMKNLPAHVVATMLVTSAGDHSLLFRGRGGAWGGTAAESLRRLGDGRLATKEDLLREIANRNLSAGTQPAR